MNNASQETVWRPTPSETKAHLTKRHWIERVAFGVLWGLAAIVVIILIAVVGYIILEGAQVVNWEFLTTRPKGGLSGEGGMSTTIVTTIYLVGLTILIAAPLEIGRASCRERV